MGTRESSPFGRLLRSYRLAAGLSQERLAERAGLSLRGVSDLERGARAVPRFKTVSLLADGLGLEGPDRVALLAVRGAGTEASFAVHGARQPSLPVPLTSFVGREQEIARVIEFLCQPGIRLLTLIGPGGVGKTRIAQQLAAHLQGSFVDGIIFVPLGEIQDPEMVAVSVAHVLNLPDAADQSLIARLQAYLHMQRILLILDNFEHMLSAASLVVNLLAACPCLTVLCTSRARLNIYGEQVVPVSGLAPNDAHVLFLERAQAALPSFLLTEETRPVIEAI
jgi:transcriptional regulator with XRE-family HTH domain